MIELDPAVILIAVLAVVGVIALSAAHAWEAAKRHARIHAQTLEQMRRWDQERAATAPSVATGPTTRLACCAQPDWPEGSVCCIACGRRVR